MSDLVLNTIESRATGDVWDVRSMGIESGSNENGSWVKFPDGTMICTYIDSNEYTTTEAIGQVFRNLDVPMWTFPQPFIETPVMTAMVRGNNTWVASSGNGVSQTQGQVFIYGAVNNATGRLSYQAIGRWK